MAKKKVIGLNLTIGKYRSFIDSLVSLSKKKTSAYICLANVHMLIEAYNNSAFAKILDEADIVTPDGMPLVKALELLHAIKQDRVAGMDLLPDMLIAAQKEGLNVFFYGGTHAMQYATRSFVSSNYPQLSAVGFYSPPFRPLNEQEEQDIVQLINGSGAHIVMVALGCPKQEKWMASMKGRVNACMIGIGGALPVMIGIQKRAPKWMQNSGLEWLYRFGQEPGRLWKRYLYTNTLFLFLFVKEFVSARAHSRATKKSPK